MGKKRTVIIGAESHSAKGSERVKPHSAKAVQGKKDRPVAKGGKDKGRLTDMGSVMLEEMDKQAALKTQKEKKAAAKKDKKTTASKTRKVLKKIRSKRYKNLKKAVKTDKLYQLNEAIDLLLKLAVGKTDQTVELHVVATEKLTGTLDLPHGTGKSQKVEITDAKTLIKLEKGKIDFDILIAEPAMMSQLAKYAKLLGPKGLMPNPKNNTIGDNPKELAKKFQSGTVHYKTEAKFPLLHLAIGKISFGQEKILANLKAVITAIKPKNIVKATLTASQAPGIKLLINDSKTG